MDILIWLEGTAVANAIRGSIWLYPAFESTHYVGIALLLGSLIVIDLRLLGFVPALPLRAVLTLLPLALAGFAINLTTGALMFTYGATSYGTSWLFWWKMALIVLAGANAVLFKRLAARADGGWMDHGRPPPAVQFIAAASLLLWIAVTAAGRFMAYVY